MEILPTAPFGGETLMYPLPLLIIPRVSRSCGLQRNFWRPYSSV